MQDACSWGWSALWELFKKAESCLTAPLSWIEAKMFIDHQKYLFSADEILTSFSCNKSSSLFWVVVSGVLWSCSGSLVRGITRILLCYLAEDIIT